MPYLILDPTEDYAAYQKQFLDRMGLEAVALFSNRGRQMQWEHRWRRELGEHVVGEHLVDRDDLQSLVDTLRRDFPDGFFGLVPDEREVLKHKCRDPGVNGTMDPDLLIHVGFHNANKLF